MNIEELKAEESRLWAIVKEVQIPYDKACAEWLKASKAVQVAAEKELMRAEVIAELKKELGISPIPISNFETPA